MTKGQVDRAERRALTIYDDWQRVTGIPEKDCSYDYEIQAIIRDAVHCGIQEALGEYKQLESESPE